MEIITVGGCPVKGWVAGIEIEEAARKQLVNVSKMPFIAGHIAVMPDVHAGQGATIGSVIPTIGAVMPAAVGVDVSCGMAAIRTSLRHEDIPVEIRANIRAAIERKVPAGRTNDGGKGDRGAWGNIPSPINAKWNEFLAEGFAKIIEKHPKAKPMNSVNHLGTLGTGNHFIEICFGEDGYVWVMLHSGSRGPGNKIGSYFIGLAKEECRKWFIQLPDPALAYFPEGNQLFKDYIYAAEWAQKFAEINREIMVGNVIEELAETLSKMGGPSFTTEIPINCHHNYLAWESHFARNVIVTRKGAIRARLGELGIIPGSMGAKSYIVRGKGDRESFCSASHGAGRRMSRTKARQTFTVQDHIRATEGVECSKDISVIDETPSAYKDIDVVMKAQEELVEVVTTIKQVICVKGVGDSE